MQQFMYFNFCVQAHVCACVHACVCLCVFLLQARPPYTQEENSLCVSAWLSPFPGLCPLCPLPAGAWQLQQRWSPLHHPPLQHHLSVGVCEHCVSPERQIAVIIKIITGAITAMLSPLSWTTFVRRCFLSTATSFCLDLSVPQRKLIRWALSPTFIKICLAQYISGVWSWHSTAFLGGRFLLACEILTGRLYKTLPAHSFFFVFFCLVQCRSTHTHQLHPLGLDQTTAAQQKWDDLKYLMHAKIGKKNAGKGHWVHKSFCRD